MRLTKAALAVGMAAAIGLGALATSTGAGAQPSLPPVSPEDLLASMLTAKIPALGGTVTVHNALGLPALPGVAGPLTQPESTFRVWSDGQGHGRLALPSRGGEQSFIEDGTTLWRYDSSSRTATAWEHGTRPAPQHPPVADPARSAQELVGALRKSSTVNVEGTGTIAGRPIYQLVLTPAPTERTLLREVRVALDSVLRVPLQLTVLASGSPDPALQIEHGDDGSVASPASPIRPDLMKVVTAAIRTRFPTIAVVPLMSSGATDSMWFRAKGVPSYGISPLFMKTSDAFAHGLNERIPVSEIAPAVTFYRRIVRDLAK